jgi:hypothetical protein
MQTATKGMMESTVSSDAIMYTIVPYSGQSTNSIDVFTGGVAKQEREMWFT